MVDKPPLDAREYSTLTLPNGLRVLLVSDPETDQAAAALDVHVGFFSDPDDLPGLAHFCEHMLFLGTREFPEENSFEAYLTANGGYTNAFTDHEDTCFFFQCGASALRGGLERFGSFFQSPLFTASATEREVSAINSEHLKNLQNDGFRVNQVLHSRGNPAHPFHHFGTGTRQTLLEAPALRGVDLRSELLRHYDTYYRAPLMTLCIIGQEKLPELEAYARKFFTGIAGASEGRKPSAAWSDTPPFLGDAFEQGLDIVPVADVRLVEVLFPIVFAGGAQEQFVDLKAWRKFNPTAHIGAVLGHEGPRSLCALLRKRGWATGLGVAVIEDNESFAMLGISVDLTSEGLARCETVLELIFGYVRLLRELPTFPPELLAENIQLSEANWRTLERTPATDAVVRLVGNMQRYASPQDFLSGGVRLAGGPELADVVAATLAKLTPSNALVVTVSRSFNGAAGKVEPWYGTRYQLRGVAAQRASWEQARPAPGLAPPPPNPFLPRSLELKAPRAPHPARGASVPAPALRRDDGSWRVFFRQDTEFGVPKAYACIELLTPLPRSSAKAAVASRLYEALLMDGLTEPLLYDARLAGLVFESSTSTRGVRLFFGGYDDRLVDFAHAAIRALVAFDPTADAARFAAQCDVLARELESFDSQQPYQQAGYWTGLATTRPDFSVKALRQALSQVSIADLGDFATRLWKQERLFGVALCQGNLREGEVDALIRAIEDGVHFAPLPEAEWPEPSIVQVPVRPLGPGCVQLHDTLDPMEENSSVELTFQLGCSRAAERESGRRRQAVAQVLGTLLRDKFFSELRTRQQLGYIVTSLADRREGVVRLAFIVQGAVLDPLGVLGRIDDFLAGARAQLAAQSEAALQEVTASLAESRLVRAQQLAEATDRNWSEVLSREFQWDRPVLEAAAIRKVSRADVLDVFDRCVGPGGSERRRLATLVFGAAHRASRAAAQTALEGAGAEVIADPQAFAAALPRWVPGGGGGA